MSYSVVYTEVNVLCILVLLLLCYKLKNCSYRQNNRHFFTIEILANCVFFAIDVLWKLVDSKLIPTANTANWILNASYFVVSGVVSFCWFIYSEDIQESKLVKGRKNVIICAIPVFILIVLSIVSVKTGWIFYIDSNNMYHRGPLYPLQLLFSYGYILSTAFKALYKSFRSKVFSQKREYVILSTFVIPTIITGIMQTVLPGYPFLCAGTTLGILYVFINFMEQMVSVDALTGLNNRNRMMQHLTDKISRYSEDSHLYILMMDIDYFKKINDIYGHLEGDNALCLVADVLNRCAINPDFFFARYGGDEFIAVCEIKNGRINDVCNNISYGIKQISEDLQYNLSLSIGWTEYNKKIKNASELIKLADSKLYEAKKKRR